jgi:hypothetical protein
MIDYGGLYPAALDVFDENGDPTNADTVTLTFTLPDGSTVTPAVSNPPAVTGQYRYAYPTTQAGRHVERWATLGPVTSYRDVFDVGEDMPPSIVSLHDAKVFLGIDLTDTSQDDELRWWLAGTTRVVEREMNEVIAMRQITVTEKNHRRNVLRLFKVPVVSLVSLARYDGSYTWDVGTDVYVDSETGLVELLPGGAQSLLGRLTAVYLAGYSVIPYHLMQGSLVLLQHVWETQRGLGTVGGGVVGPEEAGDMKQMYMLPRKVREWLGPPRVDVI